MFFEGSSNPSSQFCYLPDEETYDDNNQDNDNNNSNNSPYDSSCKSEANTLNVTLFVDFGLDV